jgi:hypothetical protein
VAQLFSLGDIALMKIYRALGVGWTALCIFASLLLVEPILFLTTFGFSFQLCLAGGLFLFLIAGAIASAMLYRGGDWPRILVCLIAILSAVVSSLNAVSEWRSDLQRFGCALVAIYSVISVVIFFIPKRYVA